MLGRAIGAADAILDGLSASGRGAAVRAEQPVNKNFRLFRKRALNVAAYDSFLELRDDEVH